MPMDDAQQARMNVALGAVRAERGQQLAKWGVQTHDFSVWITVLSEEVGEAAQEVLGLRHAMANGERDDAHTALLALRAEAVQVAAVAVSIVEATMIAQEDALRKQAQEQSNGE